jgi:hypothetical protein
MSVGSVASWTTVALQQRGECLQSCLLGEKPAYAFIVVNPSNFGLLLLVNFLPLTGFVIYCTKDLRVSQTRYCRWAFMPVVRQVALPIELHQLTPMTGIEPVTLTHTCFGLTLCIIQKMSETIGDCGKAFRRTLGQKCLITHDVFGLRRYSVTGKPT